MAETQREMRPMPDPTVLTTEQLLREIGTVLEMMRLRFEGVLRDMGRYEKQFDGVPALVDSKIDHIKALLDERFKSVAQQFIERDTRTEQTSRDSKVAVDAALQAAKEAVGEQNKSSALAIAKSESATTKQIDQQGTLIQANTAATNDKIEDLKSRLTLIEGKSFGRDDSKQNGFSLAAIIASGLAIVISLGVILTSHTSPSAPAVAPIIQYVPIPPATTVAPPAVK